MAAQGDQPGSWAYFAKITRMDSAPQDARKRTPLHWAVHLNSKLCLEYILAHEQDLEMKDSFGHTALHKAILLILRHEESLVFVKTLIIRGASFETRTDKNQTCLALIPEEGLKEDTVEKLTSILRKHRCNCHFTLTFRYLTQPYKRSRATMIWYLLAMFFLIYTHITLVLPRSPATIYTYTVTCTHILVWLCCGVSLLLASCSNPGLLKKDYELIHLLQNFHPDDICPRCEVLTTPRSHHCSICDKCVERWDHHCPWINNCVGVRNHCSFFLHLFLMTLIFALYIEPPITTSFVKDDKLPRNFYSYFCIGCENEYIYYPIYAVQCLIAVFGFLFVGWIMILSFRKFA